jgi:hypothetical protein
MAANPPLVLHLAASRAVCQTVICEKPLLIASTAHAACDALLGAYELVRHQRGRPRGMTTDSEQDLLRSMLVMAAAGLDATVKQLIQDSLPTLVSFDELAHNTFEKFVLRRLTSEAAAATTGASLKLVARVLVSPNPQARLIEEYVDHLTSGSLQSTDSLFEVAAALGADPNQIGLTDAELRPIFDLRNKIIHELDINLEAHMRTRNVRSQRDMIRATNRLFALGAALIASVDTRLLTGVPNCPRRQP